MPQRSVIDPDIDSVQPTGFTHNTQRKLTALRMTAYSLASLFMLVMIVRGVWITRGQMEAEAERSIVSAASMASIDSAATSATFKLLAPPGVTLHLKAVPPAAAPKSSTEVRTIKLANGQRSLIASIDHAAIWQAALRANFPFIIFVFALGLPTIAIFLYMGWLVNRPALELLAFAQAGQGEVRLPPKLPSIWNSVLARLKQLKDSQAQLVGFFDNLPTSIYLKTVDHKVIYVSKHLAEQYGRHPEDMVGQHEYDLHVDAMKPLLKLMDERILATGQAFLMEGEHLQFNRQELVSRFPIFNDKGEITHIGGMNFDIDDRAKAEAKLAESQAQLQGFVRNAPIPMLLTDANGLLLIMNDAAAAYYGKTTDEMLVMGREELYTYFQDAETEVLPAIERVRTNLVTEAFDVQFKLLSGEIRELVFSFFPILGADGKLALIGNVAHDLTDERRAQADLARSTDALHQSEKLAALGSMLAGVSHELNNPLAAVIGQAALLGEDLEGTEHADRVSKIKRAADRCARIVQSFLAMARQRAPEYRSVEINDQIRAAVELTEYQMRAANVVLDLHLQDGLPVIDADPDQLHQVIVNLLTNARQALEECSGERTITIVTSSKGKQLKLTIGDNGKGIDTATRERIFDPFFTTKDVGSGTGIGLSYSLGIIEAHGGTLTLEDAEIGTVFAITLPASRKDKGSVATEPVTQTKAKGRALVIDDEEDVAETLADMLSRMGMEVVVAIGGRAGQAAMAGDGEFDIILSDIRMPDLDGPTLFAWITANRQDLAGKVAFVTGDTLSGHAADFLEGSSCPVLEKPFTPAALRELVAQLLDKEP